MRDMTKSVTTGIVLGLLTIFAIFIHPIAVFILLFAASSIATWELAVAFKRVSIRTPMVMVFIASGAMLFSVYFGTIALMMIVYILSCTAILLYSTIESSVANRHSSYTSGIFILTYLPLMLSFLLALAVETSGSQKLLLVILIVVASDTGGLLAGIKFGKHKLAPVLSPKKTWEGFAGSTILTIVISYIYVAFAFPYIYQTGKFWWPFVLSLLGVAFATFGDLAESVIKRDADMKDAGGILPGHGGMLDRLDSLLMFAPVAYYFMVYTL